MSQEPQPDRLDRLEQLVSQMAEIQLKVQRSESLAQPLDGALLHFLKEQDRRQQDKYLAVASRLESQRAEYLLETTASRSSLFLDLAKAKMLSEEQVMAATYSLYGNYEAQCIYTSMQLRMSGFDLIRAHNFYVAAQRERGFLAAYGDLLLLLPWPLFPPSSEFSALNQQLLVEAAAIRGGGPSTCSLFRARDGVLGGDYHVAVSKEGTVDLTNVEDSFVKLQNQHLQLFGQVQVLRNTMNNMSRGQQWSGRGSRQQYHPQQQNSPPQQQVQQQRYALRGGAAGGNLSTVAEKTAT